MQVSPLQHVLRQIDGEISSAADLVGDNSGYKIMTRFLTAAEGLGAVGRHQPALSGTATSAAAILREQAEAARLAPHGRFITKEGVPTAIAQARASVMELMLAADETPKQTTRVAPAG